jgi:hypothetical protein
VGDLEDLCVMTISAKSVAWIMPADRCHRESLFGAGNDALHTVDETTRFGDDVGMDGSEGSSDHRGADSIRSGGNVVRRIG